MKTCIYEMMKDEVLSKEDKLNMLNIFKSEVETEIKSGRGSEKLNEVNSYILDCIEVVS